ncbi:MAG: GNAT family N-acetyltransferase [Herpetosiphonaceae bacterium]|nr:GNAT family N-acetyltransferase [Herpetosiphonaceae bacterium]
MSEQYSIRLARAAELAQIQAIELAASRLFVGTAFDFLVEGAPIPLPALRDYQAAGHIWVAADAADQPVGFAIVRLHRDAVHLHELDVHPDHGRRGLGRRLVQAVGAWAQAQGLAALTLSTFRDIPWNGPLYARMGFVPLTDADLSPELREIRQHEAAAGLPLAARVCMVLVIRG